MFSWSRQCQKRFGERFYHSFPPCCEENAKNAVGLNLARQNKNKRGSNIRTSISTQKAKSVSFLSSPFAWYSVQLDTHPIRTKCVTSGLLAASGDLLCQYIQHHRRKRGEEEISPHPQTESNYELSSEKQIFYPDFLRMSRFGILGCVLVAPIVHFWYGTLMLRIPGQNSAFAVFQRTVLDQFMFAPLFVPLFMINLMMLEGQPAAQVPDILIEKVPSLLMVNWLLWIPAQVINFSVIPRKYQVLFRNFVGFIWNAILSWKMQDK